MIFFDLKFTIQIVAATSSIALFLTACNTPPSATNSANKPAATSAEPKADKTSSNTHPAASQGGEVIESGNYHLELVPLIKDNSIHLDFFLQKGDNHEAISDANVTAQVQLPNGEQKTVEMTYDAEGKHYMAELETQAIGDYKVVVQTDIAGEKVNGRFSFKK